jgi:hypothetical protein
MIAPVRRLRSHGLLLCVALGAGCAAGAPVEPGPRAPAPEPAIVVPPPRGYPSVRIEGVPHVRQEPDFCGEACVSMALARLGHPLDQDEVFNLSGVDPSLGRGVVTHELDRTLRRVGFDPGPVWFPVRPASAGDELEALFAAMVADLQAGVPSIVCMHFDDAPRTTEHFRLVLGYDAATDEVVYHEPARDDGAYRRMPRGLFLRLWPLKPGPDVWTAIRLRLAPTSTLDRAAAPPRAGFSDAAYAQHVLALRRTLGPRGRDFTILVERPFVVLGDGDPSTVRAQAEHTVKWAVTRLKEAYFTRDPERLLDIWLFRDRSSYMTNVWDLFKETPTTKFGYYTSAHGALLMNISTGAGTLVHEIVHPFVEANLPGCPPWLNEGLGSLYEQSGEEHGRIWGYTNWRLTGLQQAIREKKVPPFEALTSADETAFYDHDPGTNYAQARYLLYYLQEKGLLLPFYRAYRDGRAADPTGYATLQRILGETDMAAFQARWEAYVMDLVFPRALVVVDAR